MTKSVLLLQMMELLRDRPGLTVSELAGLLGRSERTIYRYLKVVETDLNLQVQCSNGGYYLPAQLPECKLDLSPEELLAIRLALNAGMFNKASPFSDHAKSAWRKMKECVTMGAVTEVEHAMRRHTISATAPSECDNEPAISKAISAALSRNARLSCVYRSLKSGCVERLLIDPYAIAFRRHSWYVIAYSHNHGRTIQLKLTRMISVNETGDTFKAPADFSVDRFYLKSWNIWVGGEEQLVRVKFSPKVAQIIRETKRHPTQELEETSDGGVILSVKVEGVDEIGFWILGYGAEAEALEPEELRQSIAQTAQKMAEIYGSSID